MARFDEVFADLTAKMDAVIAVIAADPALAAQVQEAIDNAHNTNEIREQEAADEARANALASMMTTVRSTLAAVVESAPEPAPE